LKAKTLQLRPFQREDVEFLKRNRLRALVASAPGTGKTAVAIRAVVETPGALPALVVCPSSVMENWGREIAQWSPGTRTLIVDDTTSRFPRLTGSNLFVVVSWSLLDPRCDELEAAGFATVIADECHYAKSTDTLRHKALDRLAPKARHVLLLSGTPLVNRREELDTLHTFLGRTDPPMLRRLLEDVAQDIPPKSRSYLNVRLPAHWASEYQKADEEFAEWLRVEKAKYLGLGMAEVEVERLVASEALVKVGYLRRIVGEGKVAAAADWIDRAVRVGEPVVVFLEHQAVLERLTKALTFQRIRYVVLDGNASTRERQEAVDAFQRNDIPVFIGTRAAKEGITLTAARHLLFLERFWTSADEEQAEDRIRRIGQRHATTIWFLHAAGTLDDRIDQIVENKRVVVRQAIGAPEIDETPTGNVEALIRSWGQMASQERAIIPLGEGEPLPPLPSRANVHAVVFSTSRWKHTSALAWLKMHGYAERRLDTIKKVDLDGRFKLVIHPQQVFRKGSFSAVKVCADVSILIGKKVGKGESRRIRNHLHRVQRG
jgi:SNF2 family DNA or RNA helicase